MPPKKAVASVGVPEDAGVDGGVGEGSGRVGKCGSGYPVGLWCPIGNGEDVEGVALDTTSSVKVKARRGVDGVKVEVAGAVEGHCGLRVIECEGTLTWVQGDGLGAAF
jgi:hypothetical protein